MKLEHPIDPPSPGLGTSEERSGPLRVLHVGDGWYVVGEGQFVRVDGPEEGHGLIEELTRPEDHERKR